MWQATSKVRLPPNKNPPEGEGLVGIKFRLRDDAAPGSRVEMSADVYFDYNPPIRTNSVVMIYDPSPPEVSLAITTVGNTVRVKVNAADRETGVEKAVVSIVRLGEKIAMIEQANATPGQELSFELEPGSYRVIATVLDKAGNIAQDSQETIIEKPPTTTQAKPPPPTPSRETTSTKATTTTPPTNTSPTPETGKEEPETPPYIVAAIALVAALAAIMYMRTRRTKAY